MIVAVQLFSNEDHAIALLYNRKRAAVAVPNLLALGELLVFGHGCVPFVDIIYMRHAYADVNGQMAFY